MIEEVYNLDCNIYQDIINVIFTDDLKTSVKAQCKLKGISYNKLKPGNASAMFCDVNEKNCSGRWLLFDIAKINDGIIVHECVHVARSLIHARGLEFNGETEEAYAYLIQWLFNQVKDFHNNFLRWHRETKKMQKKSLNITK